MIRTRGLKILRDIWARKVRTLLVSTSIFIGVFGVVTLFSTGEILIGQLEADIDQDRLAMMRTRVTVTSGADVDNAAILAALRQQPGVTAAEGRAVYPLAWKLPGDSVFSEGTLAAYAGPVEGAQLEPPRLVEGDYPQPGQQQIAIERRMADAEGLAVGDALDLRILSRTGDQQLDATVRQETWTIAGILFQPYGELAGTGPVDNKALVYAPYEDAQHIAGFTGLNVFYTRFTDFGTAQQSEASLQAAIANNSPYIPVFNVVEDPAESALIENTRTTNRILVILALVALVVSGFLVVNVINAIVVEQKKQIGVMKSLGATRFDAFVIYAGIAVMYGLLGVIPGVLLGIPGGYFAAQGLAAQSETIIENFTISPRGIILGIVVGLAVPFLAAVAPVLNGTRVSILDAMTDVGISANYGRGILARLIARIPLPLSLRQAVNNVNQKKFRLALTGTTLTVAVAAFMGIFAVFSSLSGVIQDVFGSIGNQIAISPNEGQRFATVRDLLVSDDLAGRLDAEGLPALRDVEPGANLAIEIEGYDPPPVSAGPPGLFAIGINPANADIAPLDYREGTGWDGDPAREGAVISSRIADLMGKQVGDSIDILAGGGRAPVEIIGIANYPFDTVWMKWDRLAELGGLVSGEPYPNSIAIILDSGDPTAGQVSDVIAQINEVLLANGITADFTNWVEFNDTITGFIVVFNVILYLAAALIAAVGAIGLLTSLSMSVFERQKEIGVMRSVGASSGTVTVQFLIEGVTIGVAAWAFGVPLSVLLSRGLIAALPFETFGIGYPLYTPLVGLAGMLVVVTIASLWPSLAAARRTVSDILRYQ